MSVVILTQQGLQQNNASLNYMSTFSNSNSLENKIQYIAQLAQQLQARNETFITNQRQIYNALGGQKGLVQLRESQNVSGTTMLQDLLNFSEGYGSLQKTQQKVSSALNTQLTEEKAFQDYLLEALSQIETLSGKQIPVEKLRGLIMLLKQNWKSLNTNNDLLQLLAEAQVEYGQNAALLEKKYQYLRNILNNMRKNTLQIVQTANGFEVQGVRNPEQLTIIKQIIPYMEELIQHFKDISHDKTAIIKKLNRWNKTTKGELMQKYVEIIRQIEALPDIKEQDKKRLHNDLTDAIATLISQDPTRKDYKVSASLRGNLAEITRAATFTLPEPIEVQVGKQKRVIQQLFAENIGHSNSRPIKTMVPITVREDNTTYYYKINPTGDLIKTTEKKLSEGELLLTEISKQFTQADGKVDRLYGYTVRLESGKETKYYIAYSDKFKEYNSLANLPVIGNTNKITKLADPQPLNSNMGLFSADTSTQGLLFAILNKSQSSYLAGSMPSVDELEKFIAQTFLDMSFDPKGLENSFKNQLSENELNSANTLYVHEMGGGFILPVFQVLEAIQVQVKNINNYGRIIDDVVTSSLYYGYSPSSNIIMKMLQKAQPSDRWEWVASYVASTIKIAVELHLEQLFQLFGIFPMA